MKRNVPTTETRIKFGVGAPAMEQQALRSRYAARKLDGKIADTAAAAVRATLQRDREVADRGHDPTAR